MQKAFALAAAVFCAVTLPAQQSQTGFEQKLSGDREILHALNRLTFGPRPGDIEAVKAMGLSKWIDLQLHPERIPANQQLEALAMSFVEPNANSIARMSKMAAIREAEGGAGSAGIVVSSAPQPGQTLGQAKLYRAIQSDRQIEEVLVDFWYNHFNVDAGKGAARTMIAAYERDAIRPHVLGKFRDLLGATAHSAAMMLYLDNSQSTATGLNENYARELMELHTLGVDGGYTQQDVVEVARCFTGWTATADGVFDYDDAKHDKGAKRVLGVDIPAGGGKEDGEKVLDILAKRPSTALFLSRELAERFVADDPPPALVDRMTKTFLVSGGDIREVLGAMVNAPEFFSEGAYRSKLKTPLETVASALRATGAKIDNALPLVKQIDALGEPLYRKLEPTGYSNVSSNSLSSNALMGRMNFAMDLAANQVEGVRVDASRLSKDPTEAARNLLFTDASPGTLDAIGTQEEAATVAGMLLGSPDFQRK